MTRFVFAKSFENEIEIGVGGSNTIRPFNFLSSSREKERKKEIKKERERGEIEDYPNESRLVINLLNTFNKNLLNQLLAYLGAKTHPGLPRASDYNP